MNPGRRWVALGGGLAVALVLAAAAALPAHAADAQRHCALPGPGTDVQRAAPAEVALDPAAVQEALDYATHHNRLSVRIFRNNCLVGTGPLDSLTDDVPWEIFSSTKSVISMLTGIARGDGKLALDDPIGKYLPAGTGWGDPAHRAITIRQLLTETAGFKQSILSEFATIGVEPNVAKQALALPLDHEPGTFFNYAQRVPDLLAFVVQRAVGEDLQAYAQRRLFGPIGIPRDAYFWLRDRAGNTHGYANLFLPPRWFARLGLLMVNEGVWNGQRIIPAGYMAELREPTATNPCYGFLFWVNAGDSCVTASIPSRRVLDRQFVPSAPRDMYAMVGAFQQNNFMIPSLGILVTWTGLGGDVAPDPQAILSADPGADLFYNTFRALMAGVEDEPQPDPGPYVPDAPNLNFDVFQFLDPAILLGGLGLGPYAPPGCNVFFCEGDDLTAGPSRVVPDLVNAVLGVLGRKAAPALPGAGDAPAQAPGGAPVPPASTPSAPGASQRKAKRRKCKAKKRRRAKAKPRKCRARRHR